jgi:hypothetical protein
VAKDGLPEIAEPIFRAVKQQFPAQYDAKQSIGKRYARMDEAGTPFCFTIDSQTKEDDTVTVRSRDDASQQRIPKPVAWPTCATSWGCRVARVVGSLGLLANECGVQFASVRSLAYPGVLPSDRGFSRVRFAQSAFGRNPSLIFCILADVGRWAGRPPGWLCRWGLGLLRAG